MRVFSRKALREFIEAGHAGAEMALDNWFHIAKKAKWQNPQQIKQIYPNASIIANNRVVFNIKGNQYRLVCAIRYEIGFMFIRFIGTHAEYDKINAEEI